ncbi:acetyl-CoA carboxylase biotin carboxyl carrier protein [Jiangella alkaliphila]|uniref:Biotin carboxyl carrier protein of acetyl-CoA carboxylase n=1 Tax=Jiangella alkaliphila TaxID=419479 RepID=A0A1H2I618_9ACTN|nr:biotin/lipoyl-containing protein [Jiangella alkaliphila]SDU39577.1 acetyl-CoA carboxylase biotin carboxyl carrier protein [Jiangella alkaliphila]
MTAAPVDDHDPAADERVSLVSHLRVEAAALVDSLSGRVHRVEVSAGDCSIAVEWAPVANGQPAVLAAAAEELDGEVVELRPDTHALRAPLVGCFYRCPGPDADPFVEVGDRVEAGQTVAIIEAMKLMNEIKADRAGRVVAIRPVDGQMVEFDEVLVELSPETY